MGKQKTLRKRFICFYNHNAFLILESFADTIAVIKLIEHLKESEDYDFVCKERNSGFKIKCKVGNKVQILSKRQLASTNISISLDEFQKVRENLEKKEIEKLDVIFVSKQQPLKQTPKKKMIHYGRIGQSLSYSSSKGYRIVPNAKGIKVYQGGRCG